MSAEEAHSKIQETLPIDPPNFRVWTTILGVLLIAFPLAQAYAFCLPWMALAEFLSFSALLDMMSEALWASQSLLITLAVMLLSGIAWFFNLRRVPWILSTATLTMYFLQTFISVLSGIVLVVQNPSMGEISVLIAMEYLSMFYYVPLVFFVFSLVVPIVLGRKKVRRACKIERREWWISAAVLGFFILDFIFSLVTLYSQNQG